MDLSFAHGEDVGGDNLVDHVALQTAHGLSFGDDDNILVYIEEALGRSVGHFNLATTRQEAISRNLVPRRN